MKKTIQPCRLFGPPHRVHTHTRTADRPVQGAPVFWWTTLLWLAGLATIIAPALAASESVPGTVVAWGAMVIPYVDLGTRYSRIAAGGAHSLAITTDGRLIAWGDNRSGQCNVPPGLGPVSAVAGGDAHSLAITTDGRVIAWGNNGSRQCNVPPGLGPVSAVAAGRRHSLALQTDGRVVAWGDNGSRQCNVPADLSDVIAIAAGGWHSLALKRNGTVVAWGANASGQCDVPESLTNAIAIAAGDKHSIALTSKGEVVAWGSNQYGQLVVPGWLKGAVAITARGNHSLALRFDGAVVEWGSSLSFGQPYRVPEGLSKPVAIAVGAMHNMVLESDGTVHAWGNNARAQCIIPGTLNDLVAITGATAEQDSRSFDGWFLAIRSNGRLLWIGVDPFGTEGGLRQGFVGVAAASAGAGHALVWLSDGTLIAWGGNDAGQANIPGGLGKISSVEAGGAHSLVLTSAGTVVAWGNRLAGWVPPDLDVVVAVTAGGNHNLALTKQGGIVAWGDNRFGQCEVPDGLTNVARVVAGPAHNLAVTKSGQVFAWGDNRFGQCDVPDGLTGVTAVAVGSWHSLALKTDRVIAWGNNSRSQCDVPRNLMQVLAIAASGDCSLALVRPSAPNLRVSGLALPAEKLRAGDETVALFTVANKGGAKAASIVSRLFIAPRQDGLGSELPLAELALGGLMPDQTQTFLVPFTIPRHAPLGEAQLIVEVQPLDSVDTDPHDNVAPTPLFIKPPESGLPFWVNPVLSEDAFHATLSVSEPGRYRIEWSEDLVDWTPMITVPEATDAVRLVDPAVPQHRVRFYRALRE